MSLTNRILIAMVGGILMGSLINLLLHSTGMSDTAFTRAASPVAVSASDWRSPVTPSSPTE